MCTFKFRHIAIITPILLPVSSYAGPPIYTSGGSAFFTDDIFSTSAIGAHAINGGSITMQPGVNSIDIETVGNGADGILAQNGGNISMVGNVTTRGEQAYGMVAQGSGSQVSVTGSVATYGDKAVTVGAYSAGKVLVTGDVTLQNTLVANSKTSIAVESAGANSSVKIIGNIHSDSFWGNGAWVKDGASLEVVGNITTMQDRSAGVEVANIFGTTASYAKIKGDITTQGNGLWSSLHHVAAHGAIARHGTIDMDGNILTKGDLSSGLYAQRNGIINFLTTDRINRIKTEGSEAHAVYAWNGGQINLQSAIIEADSEKDSYAILADNIPAGLSNDQTAIIKGQGVYEINGGIAVGNKAIIEMQFELGSVFNGFSEVKGDGSMDFTMSDSAWNMNKSSSVTNLTLNDSTLTYNAPSGPMGFQPKTLTVLGDYSSNNAVLQLNTVLGGDNSATDKLIIKGDTSGHTDVVINNAGGGGALTTQGIEIIQVEGNSAGTFGNSQRIVAGAFDYFVRSGSTIANADPDNWYLVSKANSTPDPAPELVYRPEAGSYIANLAAGNTLFMTRLHERIGETQYIDPQTGERKGTSLWMRHVTGHNRFNDRSGQLRTTGNRYVMQLGADLAQWSNNGSDRWHFGAMAGYANNNSKTRSKITGYSSKGEIDGYSAGVYLTWYADSSSKEGAYVDTWALYNWFDNKVKGDHLVEEKYKSRGMTASVEGGYTYKLGESATSSYWLQPKAQAVWMDVSANDRGEKNNTRIEHDTDNNLMTRLGLRLYANESGKDGREFEPFIEMNWLHNTDSYAVVMDGWTNRQEGAKNIGEMKLGLEGKLSRQLSAWANFSYQFGAHSYSDTQGTLGVKYDF